MGLKDQLADDMENVFLNPNEFADMVIIDDQEVPALLTERFGNNSELELVLTVHSSIVLSYESIIVINEKKYGIMSEPYDGRHGSVSFTLGKML